MKAPEIVRNAEEIAQKKSDAFINTLDGELQTYVRFRIDHEGLTAAEYARELDTSEETIRNMNRRLKRARNRWGAGLESAEADQTSSPL